MKLDDFLKCKKVRCVKGYGRHLTVGKTYHVLGLSVPNNLVQVENDNGFITEYDFEKFEPVIDQVENPPQDMELTPELETEASEPKFQVGDKVYVGLTGKIARVTKIIDDDVVNVANKNNEVRAWISNICHATQENYERLQATFPDIEFEQPSKPLTGIELAKKLIAKGHNYLVVDTVIGIRVATRIVGNTLFDSNGTRIDELDDITPLDDVTGEPLTESVLDE